MSLEDLTQIDGEPISSNWRERRLSELLEALDDILQLAQNPVKHWEIEMRALQYARMLDWIALRAMKALKTRGE